MPSATQRRRLRPEAARARGVRHHRPRWLPLCFAAAAALAPLDDAAGAAAALAVDADAAATSNATDATDDARRRRLAPKKARIACTVGWGQYNDDNVRLHVDKSWTRVCNYCWKATFTKPRSHEAMQQLIHGSTWDEQQFYRQYFIYGCGGMFGTARYYEDNADCGRDRTNLERDDQDNVVDPVVQTGSFSCCNRQVGCDGAAARVGVSLLAAGLACLLALG